MSWIFILLHCFHVHYNTCVRCNWFCFLQHPITWQPKRVIIGKEGDNIMGSWKQQIALCCHFKNIDKIWFPKEKGEKPFTNLNGSHKQKHAKMNQWFQGTMHLQVRNNVSKMQNEWRRRGIKWDFLLEWSKKIPNFNQPPLALVLDNDLPKLLDIIGWGCRGVSMEIFLEFGR